MLQPSLTQYFETMQRLHRVCTAVGGMQDFLQVLWRR